MITIDDKVRLKGHDIIMTVLRFERNEDDPFAPDTILCGWIGRSEAWQHAEFAPESLEVVPDIKSWKALPVVVGDVVTLLSSNVRMTVTSVGEDSCECTWFNPDDIIQNRNFPYDALAFAD